ncbi:MAG: M20 family metallopeptidase [Natronomonas sp.]
MNQSESKTLVEFLTDSEESVVETALDLVSFDTQNPPGNTLKIVDWIEETVRDLGLQTERHVVDPAKPNLVAWMEGHTDRTLGFNGHVDTVPYDAGVWTFDPLGERDGNLVYGRGATDMKGAVASMLAAIRAYVDTDTRPPMNLEFSFVSDEEVGGAAGLPSLLDSDILRAEAYVIGEPTCEQGRHSVTVADRGSIWLTLEATGVSAHGSRPMLGTNAIDRLYAGIETLRRRFGPQRLDVPRELAPVVEESVEYYGPILGEESARTMFASPTINLGTIEGGEAINSVPRHASSEVDIRLTAGVNTPDVLAEIRDCAADCEGVEIADVSWSVGTFEPIDGPLVSSVTTIAEDVTGERVYRRSATGGGDAKKFRKAGVSTVEFALGTDTVHAVDEYTPVEALLGNALVYARLPYEYAGRMGEPATSE